MVGPAITFRIRPNAKNLTAADVADKAGTPPVHFLERCLLRRFSYFSAVGSIKAVTEERTRKEGRGGGAKKKGRRKGRKKR